MQMALRGTGKPYLANVKIMGGSPGELNEELVT